METVARVLVLRLVDCFLGEPNDYVWIEMKGVVMACAKAAAAAVVTIAFTCLNIL